MVTNAVNTACCSWAGADAYMKQLPVQFAAPNEVSQAVFTAFVTMAGGAAQKVQGYAGTDTGDHYFQRCAWAANTLSQCVDWFTNNLMTGNGTWQSPLDGHISVSYTHLT